ncbi:hypothetical protein TNCV_914131 [Trichonephila clavipes]|nr:hypothetical protein TNCV_914131 [Trichonephila clavipes]
MRQKSLGTSALEYTGSPEDERLAVMDALIEPLPCRFDCDYEYETAVSSGTQGDESIVAQVDENMFTLDVIIPLIHHIDDFMRGRIIGKIEEGRKITDVAREFDIAHSVVSWLWKSFKTTGMCSRRHGGGRVRSTTPAEDRYIVLSAKRNRRTTAQQVANQFLAASRKQISRKTVARRLRGG